ncbi:ABC transporter substrate-binding protein [Janthinobacterium sp. 17J80-10]|uniref:ABC transporter substrate-binding protein n=1 Tax=Janthinobacterium sp. 17J80-10 TaxID=2497863 RepID=UPI001005A84C|nr:ABC transporter substrate-binding protein [Janthinobacterium sp. 17J80-10]QAU32698.1 ABC transporter substrate-binding protein [Janthinobacterium sp. 17J80-10]
MNFKTITASACIATQLFAGPAFAQQSTISDDVVKIGVLTDLAGLYSDLSGEGSVNAVRMAVEDFGGKVLGKPIEIIYADHQNKADVASAKAREWFDAQKVDMIADLVTSSTALAVVDIARQKNRIAIVNGAGSSRLTNEACTPNSVHYSWDTYALANGTANTIVKQGRDSWYFLTADYAFGHSLEKDASEVIKANNGKLAGASRHPLAASDFSSFLLQAQASGAQVIALANAGPDTVNSIKAAREFGITKSGKQSLAALLVTVNDIHSLGLEAGQGLYATEGFYWDLNDDTRKWSKRFFAKMKKMPNMIHAGVYSSTIHYLKAVQAAGTDDAGAVMKKMKEMPINDFFARNGRIREDGRMVHDMYLVQVKKPSESKTPWDYYNVKAVIPGEQAYQPLSASKCPLVKK